MPTLPLAPCSFPGCAGRAPFKRKFCPAHDTASARKTQVRRPSSAAQGYDATWRRLRVMHLNSNPLCIVCLAEDRVTVATEVDHRIPIIVRPDLRLDMANLDSLCASCHSKKTRREQQSR